MKTKRIQVRLSEKEYAIIKKNLIDKNVNVSEVVREHLLELATGEPRVTENKVLKILEEEEILNNLANQINRILSE